VALISLITQELELDEAYWSEIVRQAETRQDLPHIRRQLVSLLAKNEEPLVLESAKRDRQTDQAFRQFCAEHGLVILHCLQSGQRGISGCSWVYQVLDTDGVIKIFKEVIEPEGREFGMESEEAIYQRLAACAFLPIPHEAETTSVEDRFLRQPVCYGQPLKRLVETRQALPPAQAKAVVAAVAEKLEQLHCCGVAHLDLRPDHIVVGSEEISLLDLGLSRTVTSRTGMVDIRLRSPRYAAPEMGLHGQGGCASDIYQLGLIFYELLTGRHPFCLHEQLLEGDKVKGSEIIKYLAPSMALEFDDQALQTFDDPQLLVIRRMLAKDANLRPTAKEVSEALDGGTITAAAALPHLKPPGNRRECNTVLFPARMSIPHYGHIEYIARLVELGYYVKISLQCSYILTVHDPIPKWLTMKMVAQSLFDRGIGPENFEFIFTPLYQTQQELGMHFRLMPGWTDIVAVASGNSAVRDLFPNQLILDQQSVFGREQEQFETRSWGESLRQAVRENDQATFKRLAASGVERILSFEELRQALRLEREIPFVSGRVTVLLVNPKNEGLASSRVYRYLSPEESLCHRLRSMGHKTSIVDPYAKETILLIDGKPTRLAFRQVEFEHGNEMIVFEAPNLG
jgi:serine/threonine protein kinase